MAYRAPELFDVKTGVTIDEKVDIWVRFSRSYSADDLNMLTFYAVTRMHAFRTSLPALTI